MLTLDHLPPLPQTALLKEIAPRLWNAPGVIALWVGGSLASGRADRYSDVDLRLAVAPDTTDDWLAPDLDALFDGRCLASHFMLFGADTLLLHLVLSTGDIYDLSIQSNEQPPRTEPKIILGCRDDSWRSILEQNYEAPVLPMPPASPLAIQELLTFYWINAHKHRKVLSRDLPLVLWEGMHMLWPMLVRLRCIAATDQDCGDLRGVSIHRMSHIARSLEAERDELLAVIGRPLRTEVEIAAAIDSLNSAMSRIGRQLAGQYGFDYPSDLERLVQEHWAAYNTKSGLEANDE